jgi:TP901 family phage tail tape measure protein
MGKTGQVTDEAGNEVDEFGESSETTGKKIKQFLVTALVLAGAAATKFLKDSIGEFAQFDQKLKETFTLIPDASAEFRDQMSDDIRQVGMQFGMLTDETLPALYQALSAGVPKEGAVEAVALASQAAIAGVAELEGTMKTGLAIVNAYGGEIYTLEQAYDILQTTIQFGVITMDELNSSLSRVTSVAAETRTPFEDIAAALIVMTRQGDSAAEATELLSFLLIQLGTDGTAAAESFAEATGQSYREWIATGHGLVEGLEILDQHAKDTGQSLSSMIGGETKFFRDMQAGRAIVEVTGLQMENMREQLENVKNGAGAMGEAFAIASDNAQFKMDVVAASIEDLKIATGEAAFNMRILGRDVEHVLMGIQGIAGILSGSFGRQALQMWREQADAVHDLESAELALGSAIESTHGWWKETVLGREASNEINREAIELLAIHSSSLEEFEEVLQRSGQQLSRQPNPFSREPNPLMISRWQELTSEFYLNARAQNAITESTAKQSVELQRYNMLIEAKEKADRRAYEASDEYAEIQRRATMETLLLSDALKETDVNWEELNLSQAQGLFVMEKIVVETDEMSRAVSDYMNTISNESGNLVSAFNDFREASGEWQEITINNNSAISTIMGQLGDDLTNETREAYEGMLDEAEEGSQEWINAYDALQNDLSVTQRHGLVRRLADLQESHGGTISVLNLDREAAEAAGGAVLEAYEAINKAWGELATNIAEKKIAEELAGETAEAEKATIALKLAMGDITKEEADYLTQQIDNAQILEGIMDEMLDQYLNDAELSTEEAQNLAEVIDIVNTNAGILTNEGLRDLINASIDPIDGIPAIGATIYEEITEKTREASGEMDEFTEKDHIPVIEMDSSLFDEGMQALWQDILEITENPHTIRFTYETIGAPPSVTGSNPDIGHHMGTSGFRVPGGYNRDNFLMGLSSGEFVTVTTPGQRARAGQHGGGYIDNRDQSVYMVNNGAGAAAVGKAWLFMKRRQRINSWIGG